MCVCVCVLCVCMRSNCAQLFVTPWTADRQTPLSTGFPRQEHWSGSPFPSPRDLSYAGIEPASLEFPLLAGGFFTTSAMWEDLFLLFSWTYMWVDGLMGRRWEEGGLVESPERNKLIAPVHQVCLIYNIITSQHPVLCCVTQPCLTLCDPKNCSPPGSSVHGDSPGKNTGVGCYALLQGVFPTQGSNPGLPHCSRILYCLSHQRSPLSILPDSKTPAMALIILGLWWGIHQWEDEGDNEI